MFEMSELALFMIATITLNLTPGPDMLYVATRSLEQGRVAGVVSALGVSAGTTVHAMAAAFGLSALLMYSSVAFQVVKYVGAAYLVYLGIRVFFTKGALATVTAERKDTLKRVFWQGVATNILNPKVALFFLAFLPQFSHHNSPHVTREILFLGGLFNISATSVNILIALLCGTAGSYLLSRPRFWSVQKWFTGSVFIAMGARLALTERK